ncbi:hypothetical protein SH528x_001199 [Novipirellula sp. SH528]|uniref:hypothetical protein n=1 Tax=Novipirellula sp. SH528 TaxID=3454466 RepID=UPI003FA06AD8
MKTVVNISLPFALILGSVATAGDYTIVVNRETNQDAKWQRVVEALVQKHADANVVQWEHNVGECIAVLRKQHPRYTCFVATSPQANRNFVAAVHQMTRQFDSDPFTDTQWGILTGFDAAGTLKTAQQNEPLVVSHVAAGTEVALEMCSSGVWFDELVKSKKVSKASGETALQQQGPADTTHALAKSLSDDTADLFVTSGHATQRDWQIGFRYRNGTFQSKAGKMFGVTTDGERFEIQSANPKVYLAVGNCLMGDIDGPDAMALAWMNNLGVRQMVGYTVVTWYGYGGWGLLDYFVEQPGRYTLGEAFHVNQHALIHRLDTCFDNIVDAEFQVGSRPNVSTAPNIHGKSLGLTAQDGAGLLWDRDVVAFYGDPAWQARMAEQPKAYDQKLTIDGDRYTLVITPNRGEDSFKPINTNGAQRGWRPILELLPHRIGQIQLIDGDALNPVITDDFILVPNPRDCDPSRDYRIEFTATRLN